MKIIIFSVSVLIFNKSLAYLLIEVSVPSQGVSSHVYTCQGYPFCLCFHDDPVKFWKCSEGVELFCVSFYHINKTTISYNNAIEYA